MAQQPGLELVEKLGPQIFELWEELRRQHPEHDDLVACIEHQEADRYTLSISLRVQFIEFMRASGRWTDGTAWDNVLQPASASDGLPPASAIWVVVHLPDRQSAIMRLMNPPITTKGGSA